MNWCIEIYAVNLKYLRKLFIHFKNIYIFNLKHYYKNKRILKIIINMK